MSLFSNVRQFVRRLAVTLVTSFWLVSGAHAVEPPCGAANLATAKATLADAVKAMDRAISALNNPTPQDMDRLQAWLGVNSSSGAAQVRAKFVQMRGFANGATFRCAVKTDIKLGDVFAYVDPNNAFNIVLGAFFFSTPDSGYCSKLGVLVHEISHFTLAGATKDPKVYGPAEALNLAKSNPAEAQKNAENFEYFVEALVFGLSATNPACK